MIEKLTIDPNTELLADIKFATDMSSARYLDFLDRAEEARSDTDKVNRLTAQECKSCWYLTSGIGGCAITMSICRIDQIEITNSSTYTKRLCMDCAKKHKLCVYCMSEMSKKFPKLVKKSKQIKRRK